MRDDGWIRLALFYFLVTGRVIRADGRLALLAAEGVRIILPWNTEVRRRSESVPGGSRQIRRWPEHQDKKKVLQLHQEQGYQGKRRGHISKQEARRDFLF